MAELIGGSGYDDVQNTAPNSPSIGDTWLDTSTDPPTGKIYADLGGGGQWTTDLLDKPISTAGATPSDISDGVDQQHGKSVKFVDTSLANKQPDNIKAEGGGVTPQFNEAGAFFSSGSSSDWGLLSALLSGDFLDDVAMRQSGAFLLKVEMFCPKINNLGSNVQIGFVSEFDGTDDDDIAIFDPKVGNNTSGNVRLDLNGTDYNGSVSYPTLNEGNSFVVVVDFDGVFQNQNTTGFYINGDPRSGDNPNEIINETPFDYQRHYGIKYVGGGGDNVHISHMEFEWRVD
jgi:hypothetical protein